MYFDYLENVLNILLPAVICTWDPYGNYLEICSPAPALIWVKPKHIWCKMDKELHVYVFQLNEKYSSGISFFHMLF